MVFTAHNPVYASWGLRVRCCCYCARAVPHRRGYLLHGPPGNGKSSVVAAVASHFSLPLAVVPLARLDSARGATVGEVLASAPPCSVLVLEDIDAVFSHGVLNRGKLGDAGASGWGNGGGGGGERGGGSSSDAGLRGQGLAHAMHSSSGTAAAATVTSSASSAVSLSELLNALDGVGAQSGRIVFMTTNDAASLDEVHPNLHRWETLTLARAQRFRSVPCMPSLLAVRHISWRCPSAGPGASRTLRPRDRAGQRRRGHGGPAL